MAGRRIDSDSFGLDDTFDLEAEIRREIQRLPFFGAGASEREQNASTARPPKPAATAHVLLAEDDTDMRKLIAGSLRAQGYVVTECPNGIQLLDRLAAFLLPAEPDVFDLVIADIRMPGVTGLEVLQGLSGCTSAPPVVLVTAFGDEQTHASAERAGAAAVFDKPFEMTDLLRKVREIVPPPWSNMMVE